MGPKPVDLVEQLLDEEHPLVAGDGGALLAGSPGRRALDARADLVGRRVEERVERADDLGEHRDPEVAQQHLARGEPPARGRRRRPAAGAREPWRPAAPARPIGPVGPALPAA